MKRHLNTLYVTNVGTWLRKDGENVVLKLEGTEQARVPLHLLGSIVCFGAIGASPSLMGHCAERGVTISFLTRSGRFQARVEGPVSGNVLLRRSQYRAADDTGITMALARHVVTGKVFNQRAVVRRALRDHRQGMALDVQARLEECERALSAAARGANTAPTVDVLRGVEGQAARTYYGVLADLLRNEEFSFSGRSRRPPLDPVNALLSFFYTLLMQDYRSALETVGLDPAVGYLHTDRPGRSSLALDLMEELRPVLADRLALSLINRRQLSSRDFTTAISGGVKMRDRARKKILVAYQERKQKELTHPFLRDKTTLGLIPFLQASLLARHLRNDLDGYPPFFWK